MLMSKEINEIASALAKAQGTIKNPVKSATNPFFKSKYSTLESVIDSIRESLSNNGIALVQVIESVEGKTTINTTLLHSSGQFIGGTYQVNPVKNDPQSYGSAITYGRRYALLGIMGIAPSDDDDGNKASHNHQAENHNKMLLEKFEKREAALNELEVKTYEDLLNVWETNAVKWKETLSPEDFEKVDKKKNSMKAILKAENLQFEEEMSAKDNV